MIKKFSPLLIATALFTSPVAFAQKVGIIDAQRIIELSNFRSITESKLSAQFAPTQTKLDGLKKSIDERISSLGKQRLTMTEAQIQTEEKSIQQAQLELQGEARKAQRAFEIAQQTELQQFDQLLNKHIEQYALEKKYDAIFFKTATAWSATALDITDDILRVLPKIK